MAQLITLGCKLKVLCPALVALQIKLPNIRVIGGECRIVKDVEGALIVKAA